MSIVISVNLACVASVSVRFRSKERGTRVKDRAKNSASKRAGRGWAIGLDPLPLPSPLFHFFWLSFHFSRGRNRKSRSSVFLCPETKRKRLLRRLIIARQHRLDVLKTTTVFYFWIFPRLSFDPSKRNQPWTSFRKIAKVNSQWETQLNRSQKIAPLPPHPIRLGYIKRIANPQRSRLVCTYLLSI